MQSNGRADIFEHNDPMVNIVKEAPTYDSKLSALESYGQSAENKLPELGYAGIAEALSYDNIRALQDLQKAYYKENPTIQSTYILFGGEAEMVALSYLDALGVGQYIQDLQPDVRRKVLGQIHLASWDPNYRSGDREGKAVNKLIKRRRYEQGSSGHISTWQQLRADLSANQDLHNRLMAAYNKADMAAKGELTPFGELTEQRRNNIRARADELAEPLGYRQPWNHLPEYSDVLARFEKYRDAIIRKEDREFRAGNPGVQDIVVKQYNEILAQEIDQIFDEAYLDRIKNAKNFQTTERLLAKLDSLQYQNDPDVGRLKNWFSRLTVKAKRRITKMRLGSHAIVPVLRQTTTRQTVIHGSRRPPSTVNMTDRHGNTHTLPVHP